MEIRQIPRNKARGTPTNENANVLNTQYFSYIVKNKHEILFGSEHSHGMAMKVEAL